MAKRRYKLNENFFDDWSPEMAYVLGFWFADGYMRHERSYSVIFHSRELSLLIQIKNALRSGHPIYRGERKDGIDYRLAVFSKYLYSQLLALGGRRRKSKTIRLPEVPSKYLSDFIRGYFDGDGSVFYTTYRATKNKKLYTELRSNFTSGSSKFLGDLQNTLIDFLGVKKKKICSYNKGVSWKLGYGTEDTIKLLKFIYYPRHNMGLKRKSKFLEDVAISGK